MADHILALDQGTTSSRAIVFDRAGRIRGEKQKEFSQQFPKAGWVEHDPDGIWQSQTAVAIEALREAKITPADVAAVGIANQRETTLIWERQSGRPIYPAIVWQDRRTAEHCDRLKATGADEVIRRKTGLVIDPYFSATKIGWILEHVAGARGRAERGELAFGTVDSWLVWKLTNGALHVTDVTNASRTMLLDIHTGKWDDDLLKLLGVPRALLPEVRSCSEVYAEITQPRELAGLPIAGLAGDQQAALFGQACVRPGMSKCTYGTGCFLLQNTGTRAADSRHGLLTTPAWRHGERTDYALEGSVFVGGAIVQWLRDGLGVINSSSEVEKLSASVPDSGGVYFVPALAGLGAPHWDAYGRGLIIGLTRATTAAHIARAALEGAAYQVADLLDAMNNDSGSRLAELRVDGGASVNGLLMQFQADILGVPVVRSAVAETTALGAAYLAGLGVGFWKSVEEIAQHWQAGPRFEPKIGAKDAAVLRARWNDAVSRAKGWARS